jgi:ribosomal-protein-alanine N-acetyltransferase
MTLQQTESFAPPLAGAFVARHARPRRIPSLRGNRVSLRDLCVTDAVSLAALLTTASVTRFILPPPKDVKGFRDFIAWTRGEQQAARQCCFAMVPHGHDRAAGLIQVRRPQASALTAEWGFVLGERFWGTGVFMESATMVLDFLFGAAGIHRLEARTAVLNPRGNRVLQKLGFDRESSHTGAFVKDGERFDEALWAITAERWKSARIELFAPATRRTAGLGRNQSLH